MDENKITYFAETDARNKRVKFGIKAKDRTRHVYIIGKTGMGKSTLLENMAVQDIQNGEGMCFIDPHGKTADLLMEYVPQSRIRDVIYIAPFDTEFPISFNVLESIDPDKRHLVVSGLMSTFKKIWVDAWSARMEYILTNTLLALLEAPGSTLLGVNRMLSDKAYRNDIVSYIKDPSVKAFWTKEFASYTERQAAEAVPAIQNKVGQFTANPLIRNMIGQPHSSFDFREAMDKKKIMIINLSKGKIGDENMKLLGGLLVTKIYLAAMSRADVPDRVMKMLPNFYLFVDEFQNFANASFADILSEARKYKLNLTIAHQYVEQMDEFVRPAVFGNVGTMILFRIGANDAEMLENEFTPQFEIEDLVNLGFAQVYLKLMIDGLTSPPFSAMTLSPIAHPSTSYFTDIIAASREQFAKPRAEVEELIVKFHEPTVKKPEAGKAAASSRPAELASRDLTGSQAGQSRSHTPSSPEISARSNSPRTLESSALPDSNANAAQSKQPVPATHKPFVVLNQVLSTKPIKADSKASTSTSDLKPATASIVTPTVQSVKAPAPAKISAQTTAASPVSNSELSISPVSQSPTIEPAKPVPLSSLSPKPPAQRIDPKVPTQKNVNDLRSALAAALAVPAGRQAKPSGISPASQSVKPAPIAAPVSPAPVPQSMSATPSSPSATAPKPPQAFQQDKPQEVPENVLQKVLKVE
jgi:energy-coupling factor transporter ATP-binding protein EcfA2